MPFDSIDGIGRVSDWQSLSGAADAVLGDPITPDGIAASSTPGSAPAPSLTIDLSGVGITSTGSTGTAIILPEIPFVLTLIDDVDVTDLVECQGGGNSGIRRNMRLGGGSKATVDFVLNNGGERTLVRPDQGSVVKMYRTDGSLFFAGLIDKASEFNYSGTRNLTKLSVSCVDYGGLLDRVIVGREIQSFMGNDPTIICYQLSVHDFEPKVGVTYLFTGFPPFGGLGDQIYNWITGTDAMNRLASDSGGDWRVDFNKILYLFGPTGYQSAPFSITQDDGNWISMTVDVDSSRYRNRVGVKTTQNNRPLWTDTFVVAEGEFQWVTMAPMNEKPIVRVNGTPATVIDYEELGTRPYDFYWLGTTVNSHYTFDPDTLDIVNSVPVGATIEVTYLSPLSYVVWAQDDAEIAEHGLFEAVETIPDVPTGDAMQAYANALLARRKIRPTTLTITTDRDGLEVGQSLVVNTTRPLANATFQITAVSSQEQGKQFFRHTVTALDTASQITDEASFLRQLLAKHEQERDRLTQHMRFLLAETIPGIENPGLSTVEQFAILTAPVSGIAQSVSIYANSSTVTTADSIIDILQDDVSIFADGDENKLIWPAGATTRQVKLDFRADPLEIRRGDRFHPVVISGDAAAHDLIVDIAMLVG